MKKLLIGLIVSIIVAWSSTAAAEKVVIFGATGKIGQTIVKEALSRGHDVVGVSRSPDKFSYTENNFTGVKGNPTDAESVAELVADADAIISAVGGRDATDPEKTAMNLTAIAFSKALEKMGSDGPQVVIIGGGMTMQGSKEAMIAAMPPRANEGSSMRALFLGHWAAYQTYEKSNINWTYLAPPMEIRGFTRGKRVTKDERSGTYRTAISKLVQNAEGNSTISQSDLAVAALDFAENGYFNQVKVTVGD